MMRTTRLMVWLAAAFGAAAAACCAVAGTLWYLDHETTQTLDCRYTHKRADGSPICIADGPYHPVLWLIAGALLGLVAIALLIVRHRRIASREVA
jgi:hypothetical protein